MCFLGFWGGSFWGFESVSHFRQFNFNGFLNFKLNFAIPAPSFPLQSQQLLMTTLK